MPRDDEHPEFDDATVWVAFPGHLTPSEMERATAAIATSLGGRAPVLAVAPRTSGSEPRPALTRAGGAVGAVLDIVVYAAKKEIDGAAKILKDQYKADMAAKKSYDDRAERWNKDRDKYFEKH
jgi:hypothetical protein